MKGQGAGLRFAGYAALFERRDRGGDVIAPGAFARSLRQRLPAHRGVAYALFEGLQLADFGNRIPSLTFELIADEAPVPVSTIVGALAGPSAFVGEGEPELGGYAASGSDAGDAIQPLLDGYDLLVRAEADRLILVAGGSGGAVLRGEEDLRSARSEALAGREVERKSVETVPRRLSVRHYDPARDYQAGTQSAERQGAGWGETLVDLPATLDSAGAQQRAADLLQRVLLGRRSVSLARGWEALVLKPGDVVSLDDHGGNWRIEALEWEAMAVRLGLVGVPGQSARLPDAADGGTGVRQPDRVVGPTHVVVVELPQLFDTVVGEPQVFVAACGESSAWRGAAILLGEGADSHVPLGTLRRPAVLGTTLSLLPPGPGALFDMASSVEVRLHDADALLSPVSDAALLGGANACLIGEELLQFGHVSQSGPNRYRLSRLLRGRRGTEHFSGGHRVGETFLLLDADNLLPLKAAAGRSIAVVAQGVGDARPAEAERAVDGRAMLPLSPVHLAASREPSGGLLVRWVRRSRLGWAWLDGADAPLGEEMEAYGIEVRAGGRLIRTDAATLPFWTYEQEAIAADLVVAGDVPLSLAVRQRGTFGTSPAACLSIRL